MLLSFIYFPTGLDPALVGLSMTYAITLVNTTQAFVRTNSELEILVSAVAMPLVCAIVCD